MRYPTKLSVVVVVCALVPLPGYAADSPFHECDRLAAHPDDPDRRSAGVAWRSLESEPAIAACRNALARFPDSSRFRYQYGRALHKGGRPAEAVKHYRTAADQRYGIALSILGKVYAVGISVPRDDVEAVKWYRKAAERDLALGQNNLGLMYNTGRGVPQDDVEAVKWYRKAAEQDLAWAQYNMGVMYGDGRGVQQDFVLAHMWLSLAATNGHQGAAFGRDQVAARMTPADLSKAQRLAREWMEKHGK